MMGRVLVVGAAVVVAAGVVAYAWTAGDEASERELGTGAPVATSTPTTGPGAEHRPGTSAFDGQPLRVSTLAAHPGDAVTISGDGCGVGDTSPTGAWRVDVWLVPAPGTVPWDPRFGLPVRSAHPDEAGRWTVEVTAPRWSTEYRLEAACLDDAAPPAGFVYRHERFVVHPVDDPAAG